MNIIGKTIKSIVRDQEDERLHLQFTDGTGVAFENDSFRLIRMVPEYPTVQTKYGRIRRPGKSFDTGAYFEIDKARSALSTQVGGDHYKKFGAHQPWEVLATWMSPEELKGAMKRDVISYLAREADKGGRVDIEKAAHTLQIYLELSKGNETTSATDSSRQPDDEATCGR